LGLKTEIDGKQQKNEWNLYFNSELKCYILVTI
jgi:hypothetical protein